MERRLAASKVATPAPERREGAMVVEEREGHPGEGDSAIVGVRPNMGRDLCCPSPALQRGASPGATRQTTARRWQQGRGCPDTVPSEATLLRLVVLEIHTTLAKYGSAICTPPAIQSHSLLREFNIRISPPQTACLAVQQGGGVLWMEGGRARVERE